MGRTITKKLKDSASWEDAREHLEKWIEEKDADLSGLIAAMERARTPEQMQLYARKLHAIKTKQFESLRHIFDYLCKADDEQD